MADVIAHLNQLNLAIRAVYARNRVKRGLQGARPRDLAKRFRRLLRPTRELCVELVPAKNENDPPVRTHRHESHLAKAGRLTIEARQAAGVVATQETQVGTVTGRHRVVAP